MSLSSIVFAYHGVGKYDFCLSPLVHFLLVSLVCVSFPARFLFQHSLCVSYTVVGKPVFFLYSLQAYFQPQRLVNSYVPNI
jgi:hypothetical protein